MNKITLETIDHAYVLSLDILGFGKIVKNNDHQYLADLFEKYINTYIGDLQLLNKYYLSRVDNESTEDLRALFISDTIIIYSINAEMENFLKIVSLAQVLITNSFELGIPLRGCLTSGTLTIKHIKNNDILFGKAIVDAYEYEKEQEWAGCCITNKCIETVERFHINKNKPCIEWLLKRMEIVKYNVPFKKNRFEEMVVINWKITADHVHLSEGTIIDAFQAHKKEPIDNVDFEKIKTLRKNTLEFWKSNFLNC